MKVDASSDDPGDQVVVLHLLDEDVERGDQEREPGVADGKMERTLEESQRNPRNRRQNRPDSGEDLQNPGEQSQHQRVGNPDQPGGDSDGRAHDEREEELPAEEGVPDLADLHSHRRQILSVQGWGEPVEVGPDAVQILQHVERDDEDKDEPQKSGDGPRQEGRRAARQGAYHIRYFLLEVLVKAAHLDGDPSHLHRLVALHQRTEVIEYGLDVQIEVADLAGQNRDQPGRDQEERKHQHQVHCDRRPGARESDRTHQELHGWIEDVGEQCGHRHRGEEGRQPRREKDPRQERGDQDGSPRARHQSWGGLGGALWFNHSDSLSSHPIAGDGRKSAGREPRRSKWTRRRFGLGTGPDCPTEWRAPT